MIRPKNTPQPAGILIEDGLRIRTTRRLYWVCGKEWIAIPAGTCGTVGFWEPFERGQSSLGRGCSILFDGIRHPEHHGFPMARRDIGWDVLPDSMELLSAGARLAA